jgi:hypothetical protein
MLQVITRNFDKLYESSKIFATKVSNIKQEIIKPKTFYQGEQFETFVEENLFPDLHYTLVRRTDTFERNYKRFSESTNDPDFLFRCKKTNQEFAIEAKYRTNLNKDGNLSWSKSEKQKNRYKVFDSEKKPDFIVVGLGGISTKPDKIYLFPIKKVNYIHLYMSIANKYELHTNQHNGVECDYLWDLLNYGK